MKITATVRKPLKLVFSTREKQWEVELPEWLTKRILSLATQRLRDIELLSASEQRELKAKKGGK